MVEYLFTSVPGNLQLGLQLRLRKLPFSIASLLKFFFTWECVGVPCMCTCGYMLNSVNIEASKCEILVLFFDTTKSLPQLLTESMAAAGSDAVSPC